MPVGTIYQPQDLRIPKVPKLNVDLNDRSPRSRKNDLIPPCTAPRSSPLDERTAAAVTPENQVELISDIRGGRAKVKRDTTSKPKSKSQTNAEKRIGRSVVKGKGKGKRREIPEAVNPYGTRPSHGHFHPPQLPPSYPMYHSAPLQMPMPNLQQNSGDSTSLASLTVRFVELLNRVSPPYGNGELDLNVAMDNLGVQKRRLYDVTNVLEGIGLIKKENKNNVSWAQRHNMEQPSKESDMTEKEIQKDIRGYKDHARQLNTYIELLSRQVREYTLSTQTQTSKNTNDNRLTNDCTSKLYVTRQEISSLQNYANDTVIAIRAPSGTSLEVPNPDEGMRPGMRRFQIYLTSPPGRNSGQVNIFLVQHGDNSNKGNGNGHINNSHTHCNGSVNGNANANCDPQRKLGTSGKNNIPSSGWDAPQRKTHAGTNAYPVQKQRQRPRSLIQDMKTKNTLRPSSGNNDHIRPPQLPLPASLPKFISPIESKHKSKLKLELDGGKLNLCPSRKMSSPLSSTQARRTSLKRRPSTNESPFRAAPVEPQPRQVPVKAEEAPSNNIHVQKKRKPNERVTSPVPSTMPPPKCKSSPVIERYMSMNDPLTPCQTSMSSKLACQPSFDLLNAPLTSPSAFLASPLGGFLASPSVTRSGNVQVVGTSALTNSPFGFSPNFQICELSPFLRTPTAMRMDSRFGHASLEKVDIEDDLPPATFF